MQRNILRLAIPNILSNLTVPLLGMVDTALMGRMGSEDYLGAIALGGLLFSFIYWGFGFLRMGTTGLTAQEFGKGDAEACSAMLGRALVIAVLAGCLLILLQWGIEYLSFYLLKGEEAVEQLARAYFQIRIYAAPATIGLYAFTGWFLGMQNARFPLWIALWVNVVNILFNLFFVLVWDMDVRGVAWGTLIAQYTGFFFAAFLFIRAYRAYYGIVPFGSLWESEALTQFFAVNRDIFLRTLCLIGSFGYFLSLSAEMGTIILAANQILLQYFSLISYAVDGFAFAAESLVGKYTGAGDKTQLNKAIRYLNVWALGLGICFSLFFGLSGDTFLTVFTDQVPIIEAAQPYVLWLVGLSILGALAFLWDGIFIGLTKTRAMRNTMVIATFVVFVPIAYFGAGTWGNHALWLAMLAFVGARAVGLVWVWRKNSRLSTSPAHPEIH